MKFSFKRDRPSEHSHHHKKDYVVGEVLGKGGFGEVKLVTHVKTKELFALKTVDSAVVDHKAQVRRLELLGTLSHPHIIKLVTWYESEHKFCMVFELARGGELFDHLIDEGHFGEPEAREVTTALVDALRYIHERRIVHRDIKLENVLYRTPPGKNGQGHADCVISDFGLGAMLTPQQPKLFSVCGSAGYTAPEVYIGGQGYDESADMWSFGVTVFTLMGGRFPFKATEPMALAHEAMSQPLYFPATWNVISPAARDFVSRLLTVDPTKRMTAAEACRHPWLTEPLPTPPSSTQVSTSSDTVTPRPTVARRETRPPSPTPADKGVRGGPIARRASSIIAAPNVAALPAAKKMLEGGQLHISEEPEEMHDDDDGFTPLEKCQTSC